ncbi:MAG: tyrosine-protein phosphatase [Clostridia bacterium]|nr:tyrosine-protein phosphatase [Clostridia bacterium]
MADKKYIVKRIPLKSLNNTRDLGGIKTADGRSIKYHRLIRSGELAKIASEDIEVLKNEYDLRKVVDLRTDLEMEHKPDPEIEGVEFEHIPFVDTTTVGITREKNIVVSAVKKIRTMDESPVHYMESMYRALITKESSIENVKRFFEVLLENEEGSVLFHCSAGKDRVGAACMILMSILGVPQSSIIKDYLATQKFGEKYNKKYETLAKCVSKDSKVSEYATVFLSTNKNFILAMYDEIETLYGTVENYAEKCLGLDSEKQEKLREMYLE